jgi:hypothetical protein
MQVFLHYLQMLHFFYVLLGIFPFYLYAAMCYSDLKCKKYLEPSK